MKFASEKWTIEKLISLYGKTRISPDPEYQRGITWESPQPERFVDSVFRGYPVPAIFLAKHVEDDGDGGTIKTWRLIDGLQRLESLFRYIRGGIVPFDPADLKQEGLRLPRPLMTKVAWGGIPFKELTPDLLQLFMKTELDVNVLDPSTTRDEERDLFIRLQGGTVLSSQQIRDAWPGSLGPLITGWAGRGTKSQKTFPKYPHLVKGIGKWGKGEEIDETDKLLHGRQSCAQIVALLMGVESRGVPASVGASALNELYHEYSDISPQDPRVIRIQRTLDLMNEVFGRLEGKYQKMEVYALALYCHETVREDIALDASQRGSLAAYLTRFVKATGRATSGTKIREYYQTWKANRPEDLPLNLDATRLPGSTLKAEVRASCRGLCAICREPVLPEHEEFDHYPVPYRKGGRTEASNLRLVHSYCHLRPGRPRDTDEPGLRA